VSDRLTRIYNSFDPSRPLPAGDPQYIDCREVRGDEDIVSDLGQAHPQLGPDDLPALHRSPRQRQVYRAV